MQKNLVIVESPAKAKTIEKFLGSDYKVMSSYGHIRDLKKKEFSINTENFEPFYEIPSEKESLVKSLQSEAKKAEMVWLASDEDREGEAISWHLFEVLNLKPEKAKRIVFHEITKNAILKAIEQPRDIDINLVYAQQARRVLDRIVGFKLSPVLWRKIKPSLSAGRVQSVAVKLVVEREREIQNFKSEPSYRVTALFTSEGAGANGQTVKAELSHRFKSRKEAYGFLERCRDAHFVVDDITTKPLKKTPAPPFTTSTLQQEAARKLGFTVAQTMMLAQRLYERGNITYMRTDSVNLSTLCLGACRDLITEQIGKEYLKTRQYATKTKGAQEAHEAIRPTYMDKTSIEGTAAEKRLYELIWKRTLASQMADAEVEKTTVSIAMQNSSEHFTANGEVTVFDGFKHIYHESNDDEVEQDVDSLPQMTVGEALTADEVNAVQRFTQHPLRYTEASLVRKLEELGIGRPSTYAPTISTIQQREYVIKGDVQGKEREYNSMALKGGTITDLTLSEMVGNEKSKLMPTDIGIVVNDFLQEYFPQIMDYNFTATVEKEFDEVADGDKQWVDLIKSFYADFEPAVTEVLEARSEHKIGERLLGNDPASGKPVSVKIGRFGPIVQIGTADDTDKPRFAQMKKSQKLETITLDEALELFKLPRTIGEYDGKPLVIGTGRFGPYVHYAAGYVSLPKTYDPLTVSFEEALQLIADKREQDAKKKIKTFDEDADMQVLDGRYGPYIAYKGKNYKIAKNYVPADLSLEDCMNIIEQQKDKPASGRRGKYTKK